MLTQQFYDSTNGHMHAVEIDLDGHRLTLDGTEIVCDGPEALRAAYIEHVGAMLEANENLYDLDNQPARLWALDSVASYDDQYVPDEHPALETAREALRELWDEDWQADELAYVIALDSPSFFDDVAGPQPVGISKQGGDPDLPPDLEWPGDRAFVAQLDLASLAALDLEHRLPARGMLWVFINENCSDNRVLYVEDTTALARRPSPPVARRIARSYTTDLHEVPYTARPVVMAGPHDTDALELPDAVLARLRDDLGVEVTFESSGSRLFGDLDGEPGLEGLAGPERPADIYDPAGFARYAGPLTLALQLTFCDGFLYVLVPPGDLRVGAMHNARVVYWGT